MKFKVSRTGACNSKVSPCEEAMQEEYIKIDIWHCTSVEEYDSTYGYKNGAWLSKGHNHCINNSGYIQRELKDTGWFVEISTLGELLLFQKKYGSIIIDKYYMNPDILEIEIYDDYRE